ncbi:MAG: hypothetical protein V2I33_21400, partial [Kangiellaceae bacterium]|nr:hypothetical protein [Kangiellaceae bacterium]
MSSQSGSSRYSTFNSELEKLVDETEKSFKIFRMSFLYATLFILLLLISSILLMEFTIDLIVQIHPVDEISTPRFKI